MLIISNNINNYGSTAFYRISKICSSEFNKEEMRRTQTLGRFLEESILSIGKYNILALEGRLWNAGLKLSDKHKQLLFYFSLKKT